MNLNTFNKLVCYLFVILLESSTVKSLDVINCLTYNLETKFEELFINDHVACDNILGFWTLIEYDSINVITPGKDLSCTSTKEIKLSSGVLEVDIYVDSNVSDFLLIQVFKNETFLAEKSLQLTDLHGWSTIGIEINVTNNEIVNSKIVFIGQAASTSQLFISGFRYEPYYRTGLNQACIRWVTVLKSGNQLETSKESENKFENESGLLEVPESGNKSESGSQSGSLEASESENEYLMNTSENGSGSSDISEAENESENGSGSSDISESENESESSDSEDSDEVSKCFTYNFETDFEKIFVNDFPACTSQDFEVWTLDYYNSIDVDPQNELSKTFVTPLGTSSCISTIPIPIENGILALNVYVKFNFGDHLIVQVFDSESEMPISTSVIPLEDINGGWTTTPIELQLSKSNNAIIVFTGAASASSVLLLDSFRYIPQELDENEVDHICPIYENAVEPPQAECMAYDFEDHLGEMFDNVACTNGHSEWIVGDFNSINVDAPHVHSTTFISPRNSTSCTSTISIPLSSGKLEVNIYVDYQNGDSLTVQVVHGINIIGVEEVDLASNDGWTKLSIELQVPNNDVVSSNIVFLGASAISSVLLIDSFRYLPHDIEENEIEFCSIYPEDENTELPPEEVPTFWNPVSIATIVVVSVIACALIGGLVFYFVKSTATVTTSMSNLREHDVVAPENVTLPRVANIY